MDQSIKEIGLMISFQVKVAWNSPQRLFTMDNGNKTNSMVKVSFKIGMDSNTKVCLIEEYVKVKEPLLVKVLFIKENGNKIK